jgi:hypothetical protein
MEFEDPASHPNETRNKVGAALESAAEDLRLRLKDILISSGRGGDEMSWT